jgi:hypothetical protein
MSLDGEGRELEVTPNLKLLVTFVMSFIQTHIFFGGDKNSLKKLPPY